MLATIVRNFEFIPVELPPRDREMMYHVTARPRALSVRLQKRS